jgi:hypothetical protein
VGLSAAQDCLFESWSKDPQQRHCGQRSPSPKHAKCVEVNLKKKKEREILEIAHSNCDSFVGGGSMKKQHRVNIGKTLTMAILDASTHS